MCSHSHQAYCIVISLVGWPKQVSTFFFTVMRDPTAVALDTAYTLIRFGAHEMQVQTADCVGWGVQEVMVHLCGGDSLPWPSQPCRAAPAACSTPWALRMS